MYIFYNIYEVFYNVKILLLKCKVVLNGWVRYNFVNFDNFCCVKWYSYFLYLLLFVVIIK